MAETESATSRLLSCEEALKDSAYPPLVPLLNSLYLCRLAAEKNDESLLAERASLMIQRWIDWVVHDMKNPENR